jgi:hypothetical protein
MSFKTRFKTTRYEWLKTRKKKSILTRFYGLKNRKMHYELVENFKNINLSPKQ